MKVKQDNKIKEANDGSEWTLKFENKISVAMKRSELMWKAVSVWMS
jgi:hypothetical protein